MMYATTAGAAKKTSPKRRKNTEPRKKDAPPWMTCRHGRQPRREATTTQCSHSSTSSMILHLCCRRTTPLPAPWTTHRSRTSSLPARRAAARSPQGSRARFGRPPRVLRGSWPRRRVAPALRRGRDGAAGLHRISVAAVVSRRGRDGAAGTAADLRRGVVSYQSPPRAESWSARGNASVKRSRRRAARAGSDASCRRKRSRSSGRG